MTKRYSSKYLEINDYHSFLEKCKKDFYEKLVEKNKPYSNIEDYQRIRLLDRGTFNTVFLVKDKSNELYALKALCKEYLVESGQVDSARNELNILKSLNFPFVISLSTWFQDKGYIFYVTPYIPGEDLFENLKYLGYFDEHISRFFGAQIILAFEYLHYLGIVYRDLKPENILLENTGYIKLIDFGSSKIIKTRTYTICGTPEYMAPEIILEHGYGTSVDWWALGVLLFELAAGRSPFYNKEPLKMLTAISNCKYLMPKGFSSAFKDLLKKLLVVDLSRRYGNLKGGAEDIKNHKWFENTAWLAILNRHVLPPITPLIPASFQSESDQRKLQLQNLSSDKFKDIFDEF